MVKDKLNTIVSNVEPIIIEKKFSKKAGLKFTRKIKNDYDREELFSFTARSHRSDSESIYISCTIGLYYPEVRKIEKNIIDDHIIKYPIISGSISHFSNKKEFLSVLYTPGRNEKDVSKEIEKEIKEGGFNLIETFPSLESIYSGIKNKNQYLSDYYQVYDERNFITVAAIIFLLKGKNETFDWIDKNFKDGKYKKDIIEKLNKL